MSVTSGQGSEGMTKASVYLSSVSSSRVTLHLLRIGIKKGSQHVAESLRKGASTLYTVSHDLSQMRSWKRALTLYTCYQFCYSLHPYSAVSLFVPKLIRVKVHLSRFPELQERHNACRFPTSELPPRLQGMMWSAVSAYEPQPQVQPEASRTSRRFLLYSAVEYGPRGLSGL